MPTELDSLLRQLASLGYWCSLVSAIIICIMYRHLTRWCWLMVAGFICLMVTSLFYHFWAGMLVGSGTDHMTVRLFFSLMDLVHFGAWIVTVTGLGLSF